MEEFISEFKSEASGIVNNVQHYLLTLENDRNNRSLVDEVFRGVHSLKGSSRMFGFEQIETLTHELENSFDQVRDGQLKLSTNLINLGLEVMDAVVKILDAEFSDAEYQSLVSKLSIEEAEEIEQPSNGGLYQVIYTPSPDVYERGIKPLSVFEELEELGEIQINTIHQGASEEEQEENKKFESRFEILVNLNQDFEELEDVFLFFDETEFSISEIKSLNEGELNQLSNRVSSALEDLSKEDLHETVRRNFISEHLNDESSETVDPKIDEKELEIKEEEKIVEATQNTKQVDKSIDFINVRLDRLDQMMNLLSELVSVKAELSYRAEELSDNRLLSSVDRLDKIANKFKDNAFNMRLVPLQILSLKFQRLIRDISSKLGKEVKLITEGLDTEIDKTIISEIEAPLVHIIQNAIDHGLETPEERIAQGKNPEGLLKIVSFYAGASVFIMIQDDGKGIDLNKVREKAIAKGLIEKDQFLSEKETIDLIFNPGFTTHTEATNYSGRGVGMDVVRSKIKLLRGSIDVTTEKNLGSSFTIRLPLSLSILDVLHIKIGGINYLIPQTEIEQCLSERLHLSVISKQGNNLDYNGRLIPHINLIEFFGKEQTEDSDNSIIIIEKNDELISLEVEEIIGYTQLVIKPMDEVFDVLPYLNGVSVLGNGDLAYVLDGLKLREISNQSIKI